MSHNPEHVGAARLLSLGLRKSVLCFAKGIRGPIRAAALHGQSVVRILPTRLESDLMDFIVQSFRLDSRIGSVALPVENAVRELAFGPFALVGRVALHGDGALLRWRFRSFAREHGVCAFTELEQPLIRQNPIALDEIVPHALCP